MRTNARSLPALAAAFLLAASAVTMPGCPKPEGPSNVAQPQAMALITYKTGATAAQMITSQSHVDRKLVQLSEKAHDTIWWCSGAGTIHIDPSSWKPKRPFANDPAYEDGVLKSGPPIPGSSKEGGLPCADQKGQCYEYTAELWLDANGEHKVKIDPRIDVID